MVGTTFPAARALGGLALTLRVERWGRRTSWLAILFHHLTDGTRWRSDDPFIAGLGLDTPVELFVDRIDAIARRYDIVGLDEVLNGNGAPRDRKRVLVCFDDAYASVARIAAPELRRRGMPWCFFVNPGLVGNAVLAVDNLVAYVANTAGTSSLAAVAGRPVRSAAEFLTSVLATCTPAERRQLVAQVAAREGLSPTDLAHDAQLYVEEHELRALADEGVEIGNHTADHVSCRALDERTVEEQVVASAADIGRMTGVPVRSFAYPYGSHVDATPVVTAALRRSAHTSAFLVHARPNTRRTERYRLHRISLQGADDPSTALELEVLPRLRAARARIGLGGHR